ncbi:MAG: carboxypeptidase regulatory-like domain-containing protein [Flavobacteriia bacterium]|nr:carboxypeptidase regulatory-like domain-containing protein [Flavobacteriia bacterium]
MKQKLTLLMLSLFMVVTYGFSQGGLGTVKGTVKDAVTKEPIPFCKISISQNGTVRGNAETDFDGKFQINSLEPGSYEVEIRNESEGYQATQLTGVRISANQITFLDNLELSKPKVGEIEEVKIIAYRVPLINKDGGASGATVTREDIARMPIRSATAVAGLVAGVNVNENGDMSVRGSRSDASYIYIDGIKVRGSSNLPKSAIEEVSVITGGVPANFGDITGGIVSVTTRGPSSKYFGSVELVTSGLYFKGKDKDGYDGKVFGLDKYGYNLFEGMFSGPLLMKKDSTGAKVKPILGFLISANVTDQLEPRPLSGGQYRIKKDVRDAIVANPLRPNSSGTGTYYNVNFLHQSDFEKTPFRMNVRSTTVSGQTKIDVKTGPNVNLSFGASMNYDRGSAASNSSINTNSLMNFQNYGLHQSLDWRVYGRLTQRFTNDKEGSSSKIKSAYYTLMVDYSQSSDSYYDQNFKYNAFQYGHVGTFDVTSRPSYAWDAKKLAYIQNGREDVRVDFTPSSTNADFASITSQYYSIFNGNPFGHYQNLTQINAGNALRNGDVPQNVYGVWDNIGTPYNYFYKTQNNQFRLTGSGSVNIGDHSLTLGFEFEQRVDRGWGSGDYGPISLWTTARLLENSHIKEFDVNNATITENGNFKYINYAQLNSGLAASNNGVYQGQLHGDNQSFFDYNLRKKLGLNPAGTDFINVDALDPSMLSLDMFSADELLNSGNSYVSYYGYDYAGNKIKGNTNIKDYFTAFDANGNYKRNVGAFQPTYMSGYIMDKFAFNDLIFNLGLRVDVFDANQSVLKDPYLLYEAKTVAVVNEEKASDNSKTWINIPSSMGNDYVVYVNDINNPTSITGFRNGNTWYDAQGNEVSDSKVIRGAGGIQPYLTDESKSLDAKNQLNGSAFQDYKAKVYLMPRIAFSFPISDEASFFAHYDILTQRPMSNFRTDPYAYQFITQRSNEIINNPNLKASQTIDYEIGFQQVLTKSSSLKISAFYREQRNNIQMINVFDAYPATYKTYGNRDFGTVKGMTFAYDLRRTGNIRMTLAYTLQFADGTGSDNTSANSLIQAGLPNLRTIFPYNFDQRHNFALTFDYRYGEGKDYNGPVIKGINILENTGLNLVSNIFSGSPYSSQSQTTNSGAISPLSPSLTGTTNGSRLPWQYKLDLQLDRTFSLKFGKDDKKKQTFLNVYVRVTNLLNQQNLISVYRATGNWNDDGYLAAASSQTSIQNQLDEQSFRDYYSMRIQNAFNISSPRTIRLGVKFDF